MLESIAVGVLIVILVAMLVFVFMAFSYLLSMILDDFGFIDMNAIRSRNRAKHHFDDSRFEVR